MDTVPPITAPPPVSLRLFGEFRLSDGNADVTPRARKARGLIAYLAVADDCTASRERIADLLWSDRGEEQARASLRQTLTELRVGLLGQRGALTIDRELVRIAPATLATEALLVAQACRAVDFASLARSLELVRGEFLDGLDGLSPGFDDWLVGERARQRERLVDMALGAVESAAGDPAVDIRGALVALERIDPANERVARLGLRMDHAAGDNAALHRRYRKLCDHLERDLAARPSEETRALFEQLKTSSPAPARATPQVREERASFAPAPAPAPPPPPLDDAPPLLIVAEFVDVGDEAPLHFSTAIRHEILSGLSRFRDLRLASTKADGGAGTYTLSATLRSSTGGLAIHPQLLRGGDGGLVWAERFDLPHADLQPAIDRMVARIVAAVLPALIGDVVTKLGPRPAGGVYSRFLVARQASLRPRDYAAARAVVADLEAILAEAPDFSSPKLALARIYNTDFVWTRAASSGVAERARAAELARAALALDPEDVSALIAVGWSHLRFGQWAACERHFDSALTLNPFNVPRLLEVAFGRIFLGDLDGAAALLDRCLEIQLRPGDGLHGDRGLLNMIRGEYETAQADFQMVAAPNFEAAIHAAANDALAGVPKAIIRARIEPMIRAIHSDNEMPAPARLLDWLRSCQPFRYDQHWERLKSGVALALD